MRTKDIDGLDNAIMELYKCHYTALETSEMTGLHYQTIIARYRVFKSLGILKYDRLDLIPNEFIGHTRAVLNAAV